MNSIRGCPICFRLSSTVPFQPSCLGHRDDRYSPESLIGINQNRRSPSSRICDRHEPESLIDMGRNMHKAGKERLAAFEAWLSEHLRDIKLPELLIEVDNELQFS